MSDTITYWTCDQDPFKDEGRTVETAGLVSVNRIKRLFNQTPFTDKTENLDVTVNIVSLVASWWGKDQTPLNDQILVHDYAASGLRFARIDGSWFEVKEETKWE